MDCVNETQENDLISSPICILDVDVHTFCCSKELWKGQTKQTKKNERENKQGELAQLVTNLKKFLHSGDNGGHEKRVKQEEKQELLSKAQEIFVFIEIFASA